MMVRGGVRTRESSTQERENWNLQRTISYVILVTSENSIFHIERAKQAKVNWGISPPWGKRPNH